VEWERGRPFGKLPCVNQIARSGAGGLDEAAQALVDAITTELVESPV